MLSICGVLAVFIASNPRASALTISIDETISLEVGQQKHIFYQVSPNNAKVFFTVEDSDIALYESETGLLFGVASGTTTLKAIAEYDGKLATATSTIVVSSKAEPPPEIPSKFHLNLINLTNATYLDNAIFATDTLVSFSIELYDEHNSITPADYIIGTSDGIEHSEEFNVVILTINNSGHIKISDKSNRFNFTIVIEKVEKV